MAQRFAPRARIDDIEPDMNVTPLVDIVLVLLIIFMVVAPRLDQDMPVDLPGIFNTDPDPKSAFDPLKVTYAVAGKFHVEGQEYDLEGVMKYLAEEHAKDPDRRLVLRADADLKYGDVRTVLSRCQELGFPGMSFMVGERAKPGEQPAAQKEG